MDGAAEAEPSADGDGVGDDVPSRRADRAVCDFACGIGDDGVVGAEPLGAVRVEIGDVDPPCGGERHDGILGVGEVQDGRAVRVDGAVRAAPAGEGVVRAREGVGGERLRRVVGEGLVGHRALAAVGVEADGVGVRRPLRIEIDGAVCLGGKVRDGRAVRIDDGSVLAGAPSREVIARAREGAGGERLRRIVGEGLVRDLALAAVGIEADDVGVRRPLRIERHGAVIHGGEVRDGRAVRIDDGSVLAGAPSRKIVARAREAIGGKIIGNIVCHAHFVCGADRVRGVSVEANDVGMSDPLRIEIEDSIRLGGEVRDDLSVKVEIARAVRVRGPAREVVAGAGVGGIEGLGRVVEEGLVAGRGGAVVGVEADGVGVGRPVGEVGAVAQGAGRDRHFVGRSAQVGSRPAREGVACADGIGERERGVCDGVGHRIRLSIQQRAARKVVGDSVSDWHPVRDVAAGAIGAGIDGDVFLLRRAVAARPAGKGVAHARGLDERHRRVVSVARRGVRRERSAAEVVGDRIGVARGDRLAVEGPVERPLEVVVREIAEVAGSAGDLEHGAGGGGDGALEGDDVGAVAGIVIGAAPRGVDPLGRPRGIDDLVERHADVECVALAVGTRPHADGGCRVVVEGGIGVVDERHSDEEVLVAPGVVLVAAGVEAGRDVGRCGGKDDRAAATGRIAVLVLLLPELAGGEAELARAGG